VDPVGTSRRGCLSWFSLDALALACASRHELRVHVRIDERSAGFFALGVLSSRESRSDCGDERNCRGELHACVAEASQASCPSWCSPPIVRPNFTVSARPDDRSTQLFGEMVRRFEDPASRAPTTRQRGETSRSASGQCDAKTTELPSPGPVHLNAAFVEPLVAEARELPAPSPSTPAPVSHSSAIASPITRPSRVVRRWSRRVARMVEDCGSMNWAVVVMPPRSERSRTSTHCYETRDSPSASSPTWSSVSGPAASGCSKSAFATGACVPLPSTGRIRVDPDRLVTIRVRGVPDSLREPKATAVLATLERGFDARQ